MVGKRNEEKEKIKEESERQEQDVMDSTQSRSQGVFLGAHQRVIW